MQVSVIIPTYKGQDNLARAIDSVLAQNDFSDFEIIVVDDNDPKSIDRAQTETVMNSYKNNEKVKYIKHRCNLNGSAARNTGVKNSQGKYIALLDDDDVFLPDKLRLQCAYMNNHPEFEGSYTWRKTSKGDVISYSKKGDLSKEILLSLFFPTTITLMVRKEIYCALGGFDESFRRHQDFEFLLRFFREYKLGVVCEPLSVVIGKTTDKPKICGNELDMLKERFLATFQEDIDRIDKNEPGFRRKVYCVNWTDVLFNHLKYQEFDNAKKIFLMLIREYGLYEVGQIIEAGSRTIIRKNRFVRKLTRQAQ